VTAIAGAPQQNVDFYAGVLGLRLVKVTVNVDDPEAYHLYYGDALGRPGTLLTFYCWPDAISGRPGTGQVVATALGVLPGALAAWRRRLRDHGVQIEGPLVRDEGEALAFRDPDGRALELMAHPAVAQWPSVGRGPLPDGLAIRGLYGVTLWVQERAPTGSFLTGVLGLRPLEERIGDLRRYRFGSEGPGTRVDVREVPTAGPGLVAVGSVHHVGLRVPDEAAVDAWRERLAAHDIAIGPPRDRVYYRALRLEAPGGVRLELATDGPGVGVDDDPAQPPEQLVLPPWLERRRHIMRLLPPLRLPGSMDAQS
jgi:glyoxalase family protein